MILLLTLWLASGIVTMSIIVVLWRDFGLTRVVVPVLVTLFTTAVAVSTLLLSVVAVVFLISSTLLYVAEWVGRLSPTTIVVGFFTLLLTILFIAGLFYVEGGSDFVLPPIDSTHRGGWFSFLYRSRVTFGYSYLVNRITPISWGVWRVDTRSGSDLTATAGCS